MTIYFDYTSCEYFYCMQVGPAILVLGEESRKYGLHASLIERLMLLYDTIAAAECYRTILSVNYRSHQSLMALPKLFYKTLKLHTEKFMWQHKGPTGYSFVCADSRLVPDYVDPNHPLVEACVVLEQALDYCKEMKKIDPKFHPHSVCIISSTRKQVFLMKIIHICLY